MTNGDKPAERGSDIVIAGAGLAGLTAAFGFAQAGFDVVCCGAAERTGGGRTVALLDQSVGFLKSLGLWARLELQAAPKSEGLPPPLSRNDLERAFTEGIEVALKLHDRRKDLQHCGPAAPRLDLHEIAVAEDDGPARQEIGAAHGQLGRDQVGRTQPRV